MTQHTMSRMARLASLLAVGALVLVGCSSADDDDSQKQAPGDPTKISEAPEDLVFSRMDLGNPSPDHFGDIAWATEVEEPTISFVRGDRVLMTLGGSDGQREVLALGADGQEAWSSMYDDREGSIHHLEDHIAVTHSDVSEGEGLTEGKGSPTVRLLSYDDGSVTQEFDSKEVQIERGWVWTGRLVPDDEGRQIGSFYDEYTGEEKPFLPDELWGGYAHSDPSHALAIPNPDGALSGMDYALRIPGLDLAVFTGDRSKSGVDVVVVKTDTGEEQYRFQCHEVRSASGTARVEFGSESPNGQYATFGNMTFSATEGHCYGGGDSGDRVPQFTAIDDSGRAYGSVQASDDPSDAQQQSVMMPFGADASDAQLFEGPAPIGILDGGLAVFPAWVEGGAGGVAAVELN